ncbi:hypothetical protein [Pseudotabrizicola formosa]|uniref:hypothetical protein n=1 Tax=Pseudotabrizicola formosa TaxID=2030009 RepID=UPI0011AEEBA7|nr:hypothetical protein [Pseudotabrizicola formosa]
MKVLYIIFWLMLWAAPSRSDPAAQRAMLSSLKIHHDMGGRLDRRQDEIRKLRRSGQAVELRGKCYSACTMYLGLPNVCVSPEATFGFHGPQRLFGQMPRDLFDHWSDVMSHNLRPPLQRWFMSEARFVGQQVMILPGSALIRMGYTPCRDAGRAVQSASAASGNP